MTNKPNPDWMAAYQKAVNADPEMAVIGDWFTTDFKVSFEGEDYLLRVREGRIEEVVHEPNFDAPASFCLRAPMSVWDKFLSPTSPPLYHDFFAMLMRVPEFELDGNSLTAMQNARALHRMMNILGSMEPVNA